MGAVDGPVAHGAKGRDSEMREQSDSDSGGGPAPTAGGPPHTPGTAGPRRGSQSNHQPIRRLTIREMVLENFKSYAGEQRVGPFHKSFSSVVGPNGSGKSNVIDAMLFVFGKRAKQLRLNKVSELIHNSAAHRNLELARVSVHFQEIVDLVGAGRGGGGGWDRVLCWVSTVRCDEGCRPACRGWNHVLCEGHVGLKQGNEHCLWVGWVYARPFQWWARGGGRGGVSWAGAV